MKTRHLADCKGDEPFKILVVCLGGEGTSPKCASQLTMALSGENALFRSPNPSEGSFNMTPERLPFTITVRGINREFTSERRLLEAEDVTDSDLILSPFGNPTHTGKLHEFYGAARPDLIGDLVNAGKHEKILVYSYQNPIDEKITQEVRRRILIHHEKETT